MLIMEWQADNAAAGSDCWGNQGGFLGRVLLRPIDVCLRTWKYHFDVHVCKKIEKTSGLIIFVM